MNRYQLWGSSSALGLSIRSGILTAPLVLAHSNPVDTGQAGGTDGIVGRAGPARGSRGRTVRCFVVWVWRRSRRPRTTSSQAEVKLDPQALADAASDDFPS